MICNSKILGQKPGFYLGKFAGAHVLATNHHVCPVASDCVGGKADFRILGKKLKVIIKDAHTKAWYGFLIKGLGGIGIDRSQRNDLINFVKREFQKDNFSLVITPEGTRSWVPKWRKGFYHMALESKVPIVIAAGDFKEKTMYLGKKISVEELETRSYESIMQELQDYFQKITPKYPEKWNPKIF
jgi:hypothetical protein